MFLKIRDSEFHRNGVSGEPFYLVDFTLWENDEDEGIDLLAIVASGGETFIINPDDIESKWRGDEIGERLKEMENFED